MTAALTFFAPSHASSLLCTALQRGWGNVMAPARAGAALAKLRSQQLVTEAPPDAAAQSALNVLVSCVSHDDGAMRLRVHSLSALLEEAISVTDDFPVVDSQTRVFTGLAAVSNSTALLLEVLDGSASLPGLSAVAPECVGDVFPWVRPAARVAPCATRSRSRCAPARARATQCGELHAAALLHLRADSYAAKDDYVRLLSLVELPCLFRTGVTSRCCFHRRILMYMKLAYRDGHVAETVAAGGLEFAAQTLASFASCKGAALNVARYIGVAGGQGRERRALQTGMLPLLITFLKETVKRADEDEDEHADARGATMSNTDMAWTAVSQAFISLAGCSCDEKPHPAGGSASVPQPQVVEELLKAGLPRLYLSRAVALAQHAHELAKQPEEDQDDGWLAYELRVVGHVFRTCVLFATTPRQRDTRLLMTLVAALRANAHVGQLQLWALRYCFVPLAYAEITRKKGGNIGHAFVRAGCRACRLDCCAPLRSMGNAPETLAALHAAGALPVVLAAAEQHRVCRRFAARLLAYLTQGDLSARRLLSELDAAAVMLRIQADELPRTMPARVYDVMKQMDGVDHHLSLAFQTAQRGMLQMNGDCADTDAVEPSEEDGCALSECDCDNDDTSGIVTEAEVCTAEGMLARAQSHAARYRSRIQLVNRAVCALTDAPDVKSAATARAAAAADDVMAELLAEEEAEKTKASKKKKKKTKAPKAKAAVENSEASDGDDEEETAEAVGVETLVAGVMRATLAPPPPPFRSPAAAAAAQPPPPPATKPKSSKAKAKAAPLESKPSQPVQAAPPPAVAMPAKAPPFVAPMVQAPMLPPLPPLQSQAALPAAPPLPPLPLSAPHAMFAAPLARASSAADELFPWLAQGSPEPAGPFADVAHDDDGLCIVCLDEPRSTALPGCADAHAPVLCAGCVALLRRGNAPACPLCRAPILPVE